MWLSAVACVLFSNSNYKVGVNMISVGYISDYGADISFNEPLTLEKVNTVINYWKTYFTNTGELKYMYKGLN